MSNPIKYSTSTQSLALKAGNFWFGTDSDKGPSTNTGYYNGTSPSAKGYVIYLYKSDSTTGQLAYNMMSGT